MPSPSKTRRRSLIAGAVILFVAVLGSLTLFNHGSGASSIGGTVSRSEINKRAQYWITKHVMYSQANYTWDVDHSKEYRQDCSGFVTMAWHASGDHYTGNMLDISHKITLGQLQPGDAMLRLNEGHTALFEGWTSSSHSTMYIWEESDYGKPALKSTWGTSYYNQFMPVRYNHVSGGGGTTPPPPPPTSGNTWPTVQYGARSERVDTVQLLLKARGYSLSADGDFGPATRSKVRSFQSAKHLSVDGVVGPKTWSALVVQVQSGSKGSAVVALQKELRAHGYNVTADGDFGPKTKAAVRSFQSAKHLSVDGVVGPKTWSALVK
ncbi:MAG: peptidoglycan-binding protein [Jatrophihabitans sp.]